MAGNNCLLDTNIIIALFNGEKGIAGKLDKYTEVFIPSVVAGELYFGAFASVSTQKNLDKIISFIHNCSILSIDGNTARVYGEIKSRLKKKGTPIPENDIWIAAIATQHKLPIITRDDHFKYIARLTLINW